MTQIERTRREGLGTNDVNWGQQFLPPFPDGYLSEDLPRGKDRCPLCGRKVLFIKGEDRPVCTACYATHKAEEKFQDALSESDQAFLRDLMLERFVRDNVTLNQ